MMIWGGALEYGCSRCFCKTYAQNALGTNQLDKLVLHVAGRVTLSIGLEVAQVTNVTVGISGSTVGLAVGVDCSGEVNHEFTQGYDYCKSNCKTYSGGQQRCSRWCCHRTGERGKHAQRWRRGR